MNCDDSPETIQAALAAFEHAIRLFTDDGTVAPDATIRPGTHFRDTDTLAVCLHVTAEGGGQMEVVRADPPPTPTSPRLLALVWGPPEAGSGLRCGPAQIVAFRGGEWEAEILAATEGPAIH